MPDMHPPHAGWKRTLIHELVEYWLNVAYLSFFLVAFVWYRRLVLAEYQVLYTNYWFPLIEAAVLAKVIMIGDVFHLGRGLEQKPLIAPTLYRTLVFGAWVAAFHVLEATIRALFQSKGLVGGFEEIVSKGRYELLASVVMVLVAFIPFFALRELRRVMGEGTLWCLFFSRLTPAADSSEARGRRWKRGRRRSADSQPTHVPEIKEGPV